MGHDYFRTSHVAQSSPPRHLSLRIDCRENTLYDAVRACCSPRASPKLSLHFESPMDCLIELDTALSLDARATLISKGKPLQTGKKSRSSSCPRFGGCYAAHYKITFIAVHWLQWRNLDWVTLSWGSLRLIRVVLSHRVFESTSGRTPERRQIELSPSRDKSLSSPPSSQPNPTVEL